MGWLLALCSGGLLTLAFAPFNLSMCAFIMPALLLYLWLTSSPKRAFFLGLLFGIGFFGTGSSWVYVSIYRFGNANAFLAMLLTSLLVGILSLYPALQGYCLKKWWRHKSEFLVCLCLFPATWVLLEYIRGFLFDGFPFLFLGYTQLTTPFSGFAPVIGVYGLSFITALVSGIAVALLRPIPRTQKWYALIVLLLCMTVGFILKGHPWTKRDPHNAIAVSLIQGNIPQAIKWSPTALNEILNRYQSLTEAHWHNSENKHLIIWPEGALPVFPEQIPHFLTALDTQAKQHHTTLILGIPLMKNNQIYYNGLLMLGNDEGTYRKRHLVPFGEFTPLTSVFGALMQDLNIPMSDLTPGPQKQAALFIDHIPIATFICYETAFPNETLAAMKGKALGVNIVDDAWFGHSLALAQQIQMTQMRALETGRYIAVTANTGITALINPFGQMVKALPLNQTQVLDVVAFPMSGNTPLMILHDFPIKLILVLLLAMASLL